MPGALTHDRRGRDRSQEVWLPSGCPIVVTSSLVYVCLSRPLRQHNWAEPVGYLNVIFLLPEELR